MGIETSYAAYLLEKTVKDLVKSGQVPTITSVETGVESAAGGDVDLSVPQFTASDYHVDRLENASATKHNNTFSAIKDDLSALYKDISRLTLAALRSKERWGVMTSQLENELIDLETRADTLLSLAANRSLDKWTNYIVEYYTNGQKIDFNETTADVDLYDREVSLGMSTSNQTRILLNNLELSKDVFFNVKNKANYIGQTFSQKSDLTDPFKQISKGWWTNVITNKQSPVIAEVLVRLSDSGVVDLSRIFIDLLDSNQSGSVVITPLYSPDNITFYQIPSNTLSQEVKDKAVFSFPAVEAQWVKLVCAKLGPDPSDLKDQFSYQFGFQNIEFYSGTYSASEQVMISKALSVNKNGVLIPFSRIGLEVCERVEEDTDIEYSFAVSDTEDFDIDSSTEWYPITPSNRAVGIYPRVLVLGSLVDTTVGEDETVSISYTQDENPYSVFTLLSKNASTDAVRSDTASGVDRYLFVNDNDRILDYQIKSTDYTSAWSGDALTVDEDYVSIFRNVGEQALDKSNLSDRVRGVQRGWRFEDPYYITVVRVDNPAGMTMDVGPEPIIVDDVEYTNQVGRAVLTGKSGEKDGIHTIKVHKTNWKHVASGYTTNGLKASDVLYPYNHKLLVEGYSYSTSNTGVEIYNGVDLFCSHKMKKISRHDFVNNIAKDDYSRFALDIDIVGTHSVGNAAGTTVFLVKVDAGSVDSVNETFVIQLKSVKATRSYLRIQAALSTQDTSISPAQGGYKIKLS